MKPLTEAAPGDEITVTKNSVGVAARHGEILEVEGPPERRRFTVKWEDGHESLFIPSSGTLVEDGKTGR